MRLLAVLSLLALGACSSNDTVEQQNLGPKTLTSIEETIEINQLWRTQVGSGMGTGYARLQPAVKNGLVYVASANGLVQALELDNGGKVWSTDIGQELTAAIGLSETTGFVATDDGDLVALNLKDGEEIWRTNIKSEVLAVPVVQAGQVAIQTVDGQLYLLDAETGKVRWSFDSNLPTLSIRGTSQPVFYENMLLAGFANGKVVGLNAANGAILWQERIGIPAGRSELERLVDVDGRLLVKDDTLYVIGYQGHVMAIDLRSGKARWKREASSYHGPLTGLGNIYLVSDDDHILAIDEQTTNDVWSQVDLEGRHLSEPVMFANQIAVSDYEGYIHFINQVDGTLVGREQLVRPPINWVRTGTYEMKHPARHFAYDRGIRTRLVVDGDHLISISNSGYLSVYTLD